ncbi:MAG: nuclear transport factor 2 family protein, partial [Janthinobacterium sp.]
MQTDINPHDLAVAGILEQLEGSLRASDGTGAAQLFEQDGYWRDLVLFTWNLKTLEGREQIAAMLAAQLGAVQPVSIRIADGEHAVQAGGVLQSWITVETNVARGVGFIRIRDGKIWTLLTTMSELKGFEEAKGGRRPMGAEHGARTNRSSWLEHREQEAAELGYARQPYCVIIGGGQGGIALGARLRQLNVPTIIIEKNARPGDSWRKRY